MASRGTLGGLAAAVDDVLKVLDAAGFALIFIETVGAGQGEIEIAKTAHTVIVVEAPGLGDDIQASKAGILEIADILVVNKADRPGAARTMAGLKMMLELGHAPLKKIQHHGRLMPVSDGPTVEASPGSGWEVPVLKTSALKEEGVAEVISAINQHRAYLQASGEWQQRQRSRLVEEIEHLLQQVLLSRLLHQLPPGYLAQITGQVAARRLAPAEAVQQILDRASQP
jgi:LAO/AO transport system kinase